MHVISYKRIREFGQNHADCRDVLEDWFRIAIKANWSNLVEVQSVFPTAEAIEKVTIFNIKGDKYRLITSLDYEGQLLDIKDVLTHADYDKEPWKHDTYI